MQRRSHILRLTKIKLKTGFIKKEPVEYRFMKKYPSLSRDTQVSFHNFHRANIPYLDLFHKALSHHPAYSERVYPAYWQQEPHALVLAKKQYEHMKNGDTEEVAFRKAEEYIDEIENISYLELKKFQDELSNNLEARIPFVMDDDVIERINDLKSALKDKDYKDLDLADQGEIDYFIQTYILKWNELQRERRMKDITFVVQFEKLRDMLIYPIDKIRANQQEIFKVEQYSDLKNKYNVDENLLNYSAPFYLEDYINWFDKINLSPDLTKWNRKDVEELSDWLVQTLSIRQVLVKVGIISCILANYY